MTTMRGLYVVISIDGSSYNTTYSVVILGFETRQQLRAIEIARHLETCCHLDVRALILFVWVKNISISTIHSQIV